MLLLLVSIAIAVRYGVIAREEAHLWRRFGNTDLDYTSRVRRWA